jgi:hypothetical protein
MNGLHALIEYLALYLGLSFLFGILMLVLFFSF